MANNIIQVKRTSTSGRTPNTTSSGNSQYISAGEFALNMTDQIMYTSNGSTLIAVGSNNINVNISGNLTVNAIVANGSVGLAGQFLTSNGGGLYWDTATAGSVNAAAQYIWTNTHTFQNTVTFNGGGVLLANTVNATSYTVGSSFIANTTGAYHTGTVNAVSLTVGTSFIANSTAIVGTGYANVTTSVNSALLTVGSSFIANTTGAYHTGTVNALSHTTGATGTGTGGVVANVTTVFVGNNTANAVLSMPATLLPQLAVANSSGTTLITPAAVNAVSLTVGSNFIANSTAIVGTGYANVTTSVNSALLTVGSSFIANTTGAYHTGTINSDSVTVGSNFIANSSQLTIATPLSANGSTGTATYVLTSNGAVGSPYWAIAAAGTNAAAQYTWTNTHVFQNTVTFNGGGVLLANTINATSYTIGSNFIANTTGAYHTGTVNALSHTTGSTGTGTGGIVANVTTIFIGNNTANAVLSMPGTLLPQLTVANSGGTTLITPAAVNAASHTTGNTTTGTGGFLANTTIIFIGNNTVNSQLSTSAIQLGGAFFVNDQTVISDYTIASGKNAGTFGPVTVNTGVTVTVSSGSVWTVV